MLVEEEVNVDVHDVDSVSMESASGIDEQIQRLDKTSTKYIFSLSSSSKCVI